jgi:hypothetical protein
MYISFRRHGIEHSPLALVSKPRLRSPETHSLRERLMSPIFRWMMTTIIIMGPIMHIATSWLLFAGSCEKCIFVLFFLWQDYDETAERQTILCQ